MISTVLGVMPDEHFFFYRPDNRRYRGTCGGCSAGGEEGLTMKELIELLRGGCNQCVKVIGNIHDNPELLEG